MPKWFYIGEGSWDDEMEFSEMIVNYHKVGKPADIKVLFNYYSYKLSFYWIAVEEMVSFKNYKDFKNYTNIKSSNLKEVYKLIIKDIKPKWAEYNQYFTQKISDLEKEYQLLITDGIGDIDKKKRHFIRSIYSIFAFISSIACGEPNLSSVELFKNVRDKYLFPLPTRMGWFSYNSYLYALSNDLYIVGVPINFSLFDGKSDCSGQFLTHDLAHINIMKDDLSSLPVYYGFAMKGDFDIDDKKAMIFTLFIVLHEFDKLPHSFKGITNSNQSIALQQDWDLSFSQGAITYMYKEVNDNPSFRDLYNLDIGEIDTTLQYMKSDDVRVRNRAEINIRSLAIVYGLLQFRQLFDRFR
jgi:hypothetical protein